MPRGRPKRKPMELQESAGPAEAVAEETIAEQIEQNDEEIKSLKRKLKVKKEKKPEKWAKFIFRNMLDSGFDLSFTYDGKRYDMLDGKENEAPMYIVEHLHSLQYPKSRYEQDGNGPARKIDEMAPRFLCQILETFERA